MSADESGAARQKLAELLGHVFHDASAEHDEIRQILQLVTSGVLSPLDIEETFEDFCTREWAATIEDGVVSEHETAKLREITKVLGIDPKTLPAAFRELL